jgi:DNA-directed RNA polymerase subunit N (RpoN/RPB10)
MLCPVMCKCGRSLAAYYAAFVLQRQKTWIEMMKTNGQLKDNEELLPDYLTVSPELQPEMGKFLDQLGFTKECCRIELITTIEFLSIY